MVGARAVRLRRVGARQQTTCLTHVASANTRSRHCPPPPTASHGPPDNFIIQVESQKRHVMRINLVPQPLQASYKLFFMIFLVPKHNSPLIGLVLTQNVLRRRTVLLPSALHLRPPSNMCQARVYSRNLPEFARVLARSV
ncbi:hypothetical protein EVAR_46507_1 [Eumeta japonica]|uniref:Uncharacterized protein n=1 Tax=Eumeta variegata TaxID=151549 RepID=A0A4C1WSB4_EUMVA|nr:hypothetical protein EVAR_46507_1 [Eumeta japonica]